MAGENHSGAAAHLIERAAERLRRDGLAGGAVDGSVAGLLGREPAGLNGAFASPGRASPVAAPPPAPAPPAAALQPAAAPPPLNGAGHDLDAPLGAVRAAASPAGAVLRPRPLDAGAMIRAGMIDWSKARTRLSEEFRVVQAQVLRTAFGDAEAAALRLAGDPPDRPAGGAPGRLPGEVRQAANVVMITSARPREGKSFTSLNLAASIARQCDRDVLLVDIDSKRESLTERLGLRGRPGLMELAVDPRVDPQDLVTPTEMSHLSVLSFGASGDGAELLASRQMARVIRNLGRRFAERVVILDAPPCLASSDAAAMAPVAGQIVFVVEAEQTQRPEVEAALDLIQACPTITLLLNKVQLRARHTFGGYYSTYTYN
jgi:receptor protein-tyrosine kinase